MPAVLARSNGGGPGSADRAGVLRKLRRLAKRSRAARGIYRSSRAALVGRRQPERVWKEALPNEVAFWEQVLPDRVRNHEDYKLRADPNAPMRDPLVNMLIARIPDDSLSIIDVGAGPLTALGTKYPGKTLRLTATDPLASEYIRIMRGAGIDPPVPPIECRGEDLLERFRPDTFDIAFARNALDHSADPLLVITNMVHVVKEGRFVVLRHLRRVGGQQFYRGLHQWNFDVQEGQFLISRPGHRTINLNRALGDAATVSCFSDPGGWVVCVVTKRSAG
jgi:SAM-dependent methyltransferase